MQEQIVAGLAEILEIDLTSQARRILAVGGTADSRAYDSYLKGSAFLIRYEQPENIDTAISLFEFALEEDSTYALAHAGLGEGYWRKYQATRDTVWVARAERSCRRALALEDRLIAAHRTLGLLFNATGAFEDAARAYSLALALDSTNAETYRGRAFAYVRLNRTDDAETDYRVAIALQPCLWLPDTSASNLCPGPCRVGRRLLAEVSGNQRHGVGGSCRKKLPPRPRPRRSADCCPQDPRPALQCHRRFRGRRTGLFPRPRA